MKSIMIHEGLRETPSYHGKSYERCSKMLRKWWKNSLERVLSFSREYWVTLTLLEKDPQNSNSEESSENRETFSGSKFTRPSRPTLLDKLGQVEMGQAPSWVQSLSRDKERPPAWVYDLSHGTRRGLF